MASPLHRESVVQFVSSETVKEVAGKLGLGLLDSEIPEYLESVNELIKLANEINYTHIPQAEVKYPRTPGVIPPPQDNPYNAWYVKTEIKGASAGPLSGKRVAIKDNVAVAGVLMMNGSKLLEGHVPDYDATIVTRILDAGGIIAGKAVCEDLCFSGNSFTSVTGPVLNPRDTTRSAGGSSSGSAALVAAGEVDMAIAADQGGSIRIPSSWCGVVGLKPTFGLVPYTGALGMYKYVDHLGPVANTVHDCALLLQAIAGEDGLDSRQRIPSPLPNYVEKLEEGVAGMKIALLKEGFDNCTDIAVKTIVRNAIDKLKTAGCEVFEATVPFHKKLGGPMFATLLNPAFHDLIQKGGVAIGAGNGHSISTVQALTRAVKSESHNLPRSVKNVCLAGEILARQNNFITFAKAENLVPVLRKAYDDLLKECDVIVMPTLPYVAPKLPDGELPLKEYLAQTLKMISNVAQFNMVGHPALTMNAGNTANNLPVGMMIVGRHFDETTVLRVARAYEKISCGK